MKKNLILGAALGYSYDQIFPFIKTLNKTTFSGDVCLIVGKNLSTVERYKLLKLGITLLNTKNFLPFLSNSLQRKRFSRKLSFFHSNFNRIISNIPDNNFQENLKVLYLKTFHHIALSRYSYYYQFLSNQHNTYSKILLTDVRDVIFQDNPFSFPFENSLLCFLEDEKETIGSQSGNANWIRTAFGEKELAKIAQCRISCSGTTLGTYTEIMIYLTAMINQLAAITYKIAGFDGFDQGVHNYLIHNHLLDIDNIMLLENGAAPILSMHGVTKAKFNIDKNGILLDNKGFPIPVLHQYDRHPDIDYGVLKKDEVHKTVSIS